mmetsp:Transcript_5963/g.11069  ORF Transcript_5963/g.11069 Transcript_5963/m.11069 type:complete len:229 (+) Transcript_5963:598-1284(+)
MDPRQSASSRPTVKLWRLRNPLRNVPTCSSLRGQACPSQVQPPTLHQALAHRLHPSMVNPVAHLPRHRWLRPLPAAGGQGLDRFPQDHRGVPHRHLLVPQVHPQPACLGCVVHLPTCPHRPPACQACLGALGWGCPHPQALLALAVRPLLLHLQASEHHLLRALDRRRLLVCQDSVDLQGCPHHLACQDSHRACHRPHLDSLGLLQGHHHHHHQGCPQDRPVGLIRGE